jgi:hypothetical protein
VRLLESVKELVVLEEAVKKGLSGAQFFGFVFGWMHGHNIYGRDNVYREFRKRADAEDSAEARESATKSASTKQRTWTS